MPRGSRNREEDRARSKVRSLCARHGTRINKLLDTEENTLWIQVMPCDLWPYGIITAFHGWRDVLDRLNSAVDDPSIVTDGFLVIDDCTQEAAE